MSTTTAIVIACVAGIVLLASFAVMGLLALGHRRRQGRGRHQ